MKDSRRRCMFAACSARNGRLQRALRRRFSGGNASRIEPFLKDHGIPHVFWNRVGD